MTLCRLLTKLNVIGRTRRGRLHQRVCQHAGLVDQILSRKGVWDNTIYWLVNRHTKPYALVDDLHYCLDFSRLGVAVPDNSPIF